MRKVLFNSKQDNGSIQWLSEAKDQPVKLAVEDNQLLKKIQLIRLTESDLQLIKSLQPYVVENIEHLTQDFYDSIFQIGELKEIIETYTTVDRLQKTLSDHLIEMFSGRIDADFLNKRRRVAEIHYKIGLQPSYYMGVFQNIQNNIFDIICKNIHDIEIIRLITAAVNKIISLEQQIVLEAYDREVTKKLGEAFEKGKQELKEKIVFISEKLTNLSDQIHRSVRTPLDHLKILQEATIHSNEQSISAKADANGGQKKMQRLLEQVHSVDEFTKEMGEMVRKLEDSAKKMTSVTDIVRGVAEQTNILALNSAIEAARAGEYGKVFSVVSQEIRELAEQTNKAMVQIYDLITTSNKATRKVADSLHKVNQVVLEEVAASSETSRAFQSIVQSVVKSGEMTTTMQKNVNELMQIIEKLDQGTVTLSSSVEQLKSALPR